MHVNPMRSCCAALACHGASMPCSEPGLVLPSASCSSRLMVTGCWPSYATPAADLYVSCFDRSNMYLTFSSGVPTVTP